jgi:hypothetical protein
VIVGDILTYCPFIEKRNGPVKTSSPVRLLVLIVAILGIAGGFSAANAAPRIEIVGGDVVDFGRGRPGRYQREVAITNSGSDTLRIIAVNSGCGCLVGEPDRRALGRGDTARIAITVETSGQVVERWQKALTITTNDPIRPNLDVTVLVSFRHDLRLHSLINTVQRERCDTCAWSIDVENIGDTPLVIQPPLAEEMRGLIVAFDMKAPDTLSPGERRAIPARISIVGGEQYPSARVLLVTSSEFDRETYVSWFYAPGE